MKKIAVLIMMVQCGVLFAAEESLDTKRANQPVKFSIRAGAEYTDNRDAAPIKESNVDLYITPMIALDLKWEETMLELSYEPTFRYRNSPSIYQNKNNLFHDLGVKFVQKLSPNLQFRLIDDFNITDDPSIQENGSTLRRDYSFTLNQTEAGMKYMFSRLSNVDVLGRYMFKRYNDSVTRTESDENRTDVGLTVWHQPGKQLALNGQINYSKYGYEKYLGADRGFDSMLFCVGVEEVFSPLFRIGAKGGVQSLKYVDKSMESATEPYGNLFGQITPMPSTRITAAITRMTRESFIFPFSSQKSTDLSLRLDWDAPMPELKFGLVGSYRIGDYSGSTVPSSLKNQYATDPLLKEYVSAYQLKESGKENTYVLAADVSYKIGYGTTIKFVQSYENVDSDVRWSFKRNASNIMMTREF